MLPTIPNDHTLRRQVIGLVQILMAFDWSLLKLEDFTKLLWSLDYAEFLSGKEEVEEALYLKYYS